MSTKIFGDKMLVTTRFSMHARTCKCFLGRKDRSRKDFLNQRKREREERELERLRLNSSIIIQSGLSQNPKNPIFSETFRFEDFDPLSNQRIE